jgi:hypothetical protein
MRLLPIAASLVAANLAVLAVPLAGIAAPVYEGFEYASGASLGGQNGGSGWAGAWNAGATILDVRIGAGLGFPGLATAPGAATSDPAVAGSVAFFTRQLASGYGADNTTLYLSVLLRPDAGFGFYGGLNLGGVFVGKSGTTATYGIEDATNAVSSSLVAAVAGETVLLVLRADFLPGNDRFALYIDPTPGGPEPGTPDALKTDFDLPPDSFVFLNNAGSWTTDEIRIGDSFAAVTAAAVPEPAVLGVFAVAVMGLAIGRRRRRARA